MLQTIVHGSVRTIHDRFMLVTRAASDRASRARCASARLQGCRVAMAHRAAGCYRVLMVVPGTPRKARPLHDALEARPLQTKRTRPVSGAYSAWLGLGLGLG